MISRKYKKLLDRETPYKEENIALLKKITDGNKYLAWEFICMNIRFVKHVLTQKFKKADITGEVFSDGLLGFYKSLIRAKPDCPYSVFLGYASRYIWGYAYGGMKASRSQLKTSKHVPQISLDGSSFISDSENWYSSGIQMESIEMSNGSTDTITDNCLRHDDSSYCKNLIKHFISGGINLTNKQKEVLIALAKHGGNGVEAAKELNVTKQMIHITKQRIVWKIATFLKGHPQIRGELFEIIDADTEKFFNTNLMDKIPK